MPLTGSTSTFAPTGYIPDTFPFRSAGDIISETDWNHLGDALYNTEVAVADLSRSRDTRINPESRIWWGNFTPVWDLASSQQLSATGRILLPTSACFYLGTATPLAPENLVKVNCRVDMLPATRYGYGTNVTSAFWCPVNALPSGSSSARFPGSSVGLNGQILTSSGTIGGTISEAEREIYVGLFFDGYPVPVDLNSWDIVCSVLIIAPEIGD